MRPLAALFGREVALAWGRGGGPLLAVGFLAAGTTLMPLALGPAPGPLEAVAAGVTWVALALASLLTLDRMFERDFEDGALDLLALGPLPLEAVAVVKCLAQWLVNGAPLALALIKTFQTMLSLKLQMIDRHQGEPLAHQVHHRRQRLRLHECEHGKHLCQQCGYRFQCRRYRRFHLPHTWQHWSDHLAAARGI